jgi:hypothetical protein
MRRWWWVLLGGACASVVKTEGFRASILEASDPALVGRFSGEGSASCGRYTPERQIIELRSDALTLDAQRTAGGSTAVVVVGGQRFVNDRPGARVDMVADHPGGRLIGSLSAVLVHESAGTVVDGRPAPIRTLQLEVTFNLQPCL